MKNTFIILFLFLFSVNALSQIEKRTKVQKKELSNSILKDLADNSCKCIDSISQNNTARKFVIAKIQTCIDKQVGALQIMDQITTIDLEKDPKESKKINIVINENKKSSQYKAYYYKLERYLMDSCKVMKIKVAHSNSFDLALSANKEALNFYIKGLDATENKNYRKAIKLYKKAIKKDPQFAYAYDNMGICYRRLKKYDKAIKAYKASLKINPEGSMPLQNIAVVYDYKKEYKNAINAYKKLIKINPKNPESYYGIGRNYANLRDFEKSLDYMCKAYVIYLKQKSPYRTDAENMINYIFMELKKKDKAAFFHETLKKYHISISKEKK